MKETAIHVTEVVEATPPTDGAAVGAQSTAVQPVEESESKKDPRTDAMLLDQFIKERCGNSENTATSYRSMIRRLAKFCQYNGMRSMREFQRDQWPQYAAYLASPPAEHIMQRSLPLDHKKWQPFRGPLSPASRNLAQIVAKSFFEWLSDPAIGAIEINPVASVRAKRVRRSASAESIDRFIPEDCMPYVEAALARMYGDDHVDGKNRDEVRYRMRARARWIIDLGLLTGLRASEMALADSSMIRPGITAGTMSLHIRRKGGVQAKMPLMPEVIEGYKRYLAAYGLTWQRTIALPLVMPARLGTAPVINGQVAVKHATRGSIWRIVKDVMRAAAAEANASDDPTAAHRLASASTHWLRHTFATSLLDAGGDIRVARDLLDHGDISTTSRYTHTVETQMRDDLKKLSDRLQRRGDKPG